MPDFRYINDALARSGNDPITSLTDGSAAARVTLLSYENIVKDALAGYPWKWATKTATINMIGTAAAPWGYTYQMPTDLMRLRSLAIEGTAIDYEVQYDKILTLYDSASDLTLKYVWRVPEAGWPGWFAEYIVVRLEAVYLRGLSHKYDEAEKRDDAAKVLLRRARLQDSQLARPRDPVSSPTLEARSG